ncbi:MAG: acyl-ACP--UDP-N-acetylglucosamine O-acyltransferase [Burkholderiales bacterium]|nr:acyl-ACP--UDP-N-acetylglucosamine O-acyltransferase [Burkholderiales bacterium]
MIHPTALIDPGAHLEAGVSVGPYAVIEAGTMIGQGCAIAAHAVIKRHTRLGPRNRVGEFAVLGGEPQDYKFQGAESYVEIGADNRFGEGVTVHRSNHAGGVTRIGSGCFLMAMSHVAHDCSLGDQVILANGALLGGHVEVGDRAFVSGAVTVHQYCRIGELAMVAASSRVNQDCLPYMIADGNPARTRAVNVVGLRRAGYSAEDIAALKRALHRLRASTSEAELLAALEAEANPAVARMAAFIRASRRGWAHCR